MVKESNGKITAIQAAIDELDRVFHEKARLGILTTLISSPSGMNFSELKELCDLTDGNLNRHLKVLIDTQILKVKKTGQGRNTNSHYSLTPKGRRAFERYLQALEKVLKAAKGIDNGKLIMESGKLGMES